MQQEYPLRPEPCEYTCLAQLYQEFSRIFLQTGKVDSTCSHTIMIFDHHFFHMAAIEIESPERLFMAKEKSKILSIREGFGYYKLLYGGARARNLPSAYAVIANPDEVWEGNPRCTSAKWVYIKQFASTPYPFSVALIAPGHKKNIMVPVSSFPCRRSDIKRWRHGKRIY